MSKSKDFIKQRMDAGSFSDLGKDDIDDAMEFEFLDFCEKNNILVPAYVVFDDGADFGYCSNNACVCDSTLVFAIEMIYGVISNVILKKTYPLGVEHDVNSNIKYIVGNIILVSKNAEPQKEDKPWLNYLYNAILPVKYIKGSPL